MIESASLEHLEQACNNLVQIDKEGKNNPHFLALIDSTNYKDLEGEDKTQFNFSSVFLFFFLPGQTALSSHMFSNH